MRRSFWAPPVVATLSGLVLLLAAAGAWVAGQDARDMGGVLVTEPVATSGTRFAPTAVVLGLAGLLTGVALGAVRGAARRWVGVVVAVIGIGTVAVLVVGVSRALADEGALTPAPYFAITAAGALLVAGLGAFRGPDRPPDRSRYRVASEQSGDDEWSLASDEGDAGSSDG